MTERERKLFARYEKYLEDLKKRIQREFVRLNAAGFDELDIIRLNRRTRAMYRRLEAYNEQQYEDLAEEAFAWCQDYMEAYGVRLKPQEVVREILNGYNPVTQYVYSNEIGRKRMRLNEAILTAREVQDRKMYEEAIKKASSLWFTQSKQYAIEIVIGTIMAVLKEKDARWLRWNTMEDERVCPECRSRNGEIYPFSEYPSRPHYGCRCYPTMVRRK